MKHCKSKTKGGSPCRGYAIEGSEFCFTHDPTRAAERAAAHKRGGENRPRSTYGAPFPEGVNVKTGTGLLELLEHAIKDVWALESSIARARTLGYLAQVQRGVLDVNLEERVKRLEEQYAQSRKAN